MLVVRSGRECGRADSRSSTPLQRLAARSQREHHVKRHHSRVRRSGHVPGDCGARSRDRLRGDWRDDRGAAVVQRATQARPVPRRC